eukprot:gnl/Trimastix_PCT/252.p3 GENE.gnl/Trimastix_PCT/252~~gnl/Trimastix_PCT/252.p3  ORF type:complete len:216 (-),score=57.05 gnl/Trimastix_PCT/252:745-1335(-)
MEQNPGSDEFAGMGEGSRYQVSDAAKVDLQTAIGRDAEDESLNRWKQSILAGAGAGDTSDPRHLVLHRMQLEAEDHTLVFQLMTPEDINRLKTDRFVLKEGVDYQLAFYFKVQHDVVPALKFMQATYRGPIRVDRGSFAMGSFAPKPDTQIFRFPTMKAPKGMMSRGTYKCKCRVCDDEQTHLEFEYTLDIKKNWE